MSTIFYKDNPYGGTTTVTDAGHVLVTQGSDTVTAQAKFNTQTTAIQRILGNFATVEESTTASKAYNVGDYLVLNSFLYKVTYPIAAGGTIDNTQNGNVVKTTVSDEFSNASNVNYNNATSGLTATDVQGAVDELNSNTQSILKYQATDYAPEISSIGAGSGQVITVPIAVPNGYQLVGNCYVGAVWVAGLTVTFDGDYTTSTNPRVYVFNPTNVAKNTASLHIKIYSLFEKVV